MNVLLKKEYSDILIVHGRMIMGGVEKALLAMLDALEGKGVSVTLLLLKSGGDLFNQIPGWVNVEILQGFSENEFIINDPPTTTVVRLLKSGDILGSAKAAKRAADIKFSKTDKWYLNFKALLDTLPTTYSAKIALSYRGLDYIVPYYVLEKVQAEHKFVWIHGDVKHHIFPNNVIAKKLFSRFEKIFGVSEDVKKSIDEMFPHLADRTEVFRNLIPEKQIKKLADTTQTPFEENFSGINIVTVGRLSELKGQDRIPAIARRLLKLNIPFRWYLVGEGEMRDKIEQLIKKNEVKNYVILLGNQMNPYPYLKNCDIYVQTSHTEGASVVMHEAKIFERPIITTEVASAYLIVKDGVDGLIVNNSEDGLYQGVAELLRNPDKRKNFEKFELKDCQNSGTTVDNLVKMVKTK